MVSGRKTYHDFDYRGCIGKTEIMRREKGDREQKKKPHVVGVTFLDMVPPGAYA